MSLPRPHFLFYDIESTGLSKCFDQVLQFAGIWTDLELNEIKREEIIVKLNPDVIPNPHASITHHIGLADLQHGISEYAAISQIHAWFNTPGCMSLGYNTLGFDDEFLRLSFYRNLLDPYSHQYANGCLRLDLFPITVMYYLFKPECLHWPQRDGKTSLKLEALSQINHLASGRAHDAMVDVQATVELARRLAVDSAMWQYCLSHFKKSEFAKHTTKLHSTTIGEQNCKTALLINAKFGHKNAYQATSVLLGEHKIYKNQMVWLRLDEMPLAKLLEISAPNTQHSQDELTAAQLEAVQTYNLRPCEQTWCLPVEARFLSHQSSERQNIYMNNINWLQQQPAILQQITTHHCQKTWPEVANIDVQAALYTRPFISRAQRQQFNSFHAAPNVKQKHQIAQQFPDELDRELAMRLLGRNFYHTLSEDLRQLFDDYLQYCYNGDKPRVDYQDHTAAMPSNMLQEIEQLEKTHTKHGVITAAQQQLLAELKQLYLKLSPIREL